MSKWTAWLGGNGVRCRCPFVGSWGPTTTASLRLRTTCRDLGCGAAVFADHWTGSGSWDAMPDDRRARFAEALRPDFHEWDEVMNESLTVDDWRSALPDDTTVISAADTVGSLAEIVDLLSASCPGRRFIEVAEGGHMAVLTRPEVMIPHLVQALS